ncbi:MAG: hypothetical protein ACYDBV_15280, partial [Nitrospiria bacterium]
MGSFESLGFQPQSNAAPIQNVGAKGDQFANMGFVAHEAPQATPSNGNANPDSDEKSGAPSKAMTALESFGNGLSLGYLPHLQALGEKIETPVLNYLTGKNVPTDDYLSARDANIQRQQQQMQANPKTALAGNIAGGLTTGIATMGLMAPAAEAGTAANVAKTASLASKVGQGVMTGAKVGATFGAIANPGDTQGEISPLQLSQRAQGAYQGAKFGALVGGAAPVVAEGFKQIPTAATAAAKKVGRIFYVPEAATQAYIENPDAINNAATREDISNRVLALKENAQSQVDSAQQALQDAKDAASETKTDTKFGLQNQKFATSQDAAEAQRLVDQKTAEFRQSLKSENLTGMVGDVHDAIGALKDKVVQGSNDAYSILDKSQGSVETAPLVNLLQDHADSLKVNGVPTSKSASQAVNEIEEMQGRLKQMGPSLSLSQSKQILQGLDKDINWQNSPGGFAPQSDQAFQEMRGNLDAKVKMQSPEYRQQMQEVARQTKILGQANDAFGTPEKAISNLNNLTSQRGQAIHMPLLQSLESETGANLSARANNYLLKQRILTSPTLFQQYVENMPESKELAKIQAQRAEIQNPEYSQGVVNEAMNPAQQEVASRQSMLDRAKERAARFQGVTAQSITSKTKALNGANQYGAEATFGPIDQAYGTNFQNEIRARNMADAFSKDATRGSRFVNLGRGLGAAGGAAVGGIPGAVVGQGIGGAIGATADVYGPQMFKKSLDAGMAMGRGVNNMGNFISGNPGAVVGGASGGQTGLSLVPAGSAPAAASSPQK